MKKPVIGINCDVEKNPGKGTRSYLEQEYLTAVGSMDAELVEPFYANDPDFRVYFDGQSATRDELLSLIDGLGSALDSFEGKWGDIEVTPLNIEVALAAARFTRTLVDKTGVSVNDWGTVTWVWIFRDELWQLIHGHAVHYPEES